MIMAVVLLALPLGYLVPRWLVANVTFGLAFAHVYTFQTSTLVMGWVNGDTRAFSQSDSPEVLAGTVGYALASTAIYAAGFGLVAAGHLLRRRRNRNRDGVDLHANA